MKKDLVKEYKIEIGQVQVFDTYMVAVLNEGITLTLEKTFELIGISEVHFSNKDFAYITVRENSYSVDPTMYTQIRELRNLKAVAIVSSKEVDKQNYIIEKHFFGKKMRIFENLDSAVAWVNSIIE